VKLLDSELLRVWLLAGFYSFPEAARERSFAKLRFDTYNWKQNFRKVPAQAEPGTEWRVKPMPVR